MCNQDKLTFTVKHSLTAQQAHGVECLRAQQLMVICKISSPGGVA
jgi:hypothetical protein